MRLHMVALLATGGLVVAAAGVALRWWRGPSLNDLYPDPVLGDYADEVAANLAELRRRRVIG